MSALCSFALCSLQELPTQGVGEEWVISDTATDSFLTECEEWRREGTQGSLKF